MSYDVVALLAGEPGMRAVSRALREAGPELGVRALSGGGVLQLRDADRGVLATLEPAQLVESRGEVVRLLGAEAAVNLPDTCWWTEVRARPDDAGREAAHRLADALALHLGGSVWTSGRADFSLWREGDRSADDHPAVECAAEEAIVIAQDREVVPLSSWVLDAVSAHAERGRALQLLTPWTSRLTYALRTLLAQPMARWVVRDGSGGHFDGISGLPLRWDPVHAFVPAPPEEAPEPARGFLDDSPLGEHLVVDLSVRHRRSFAPPLGRAVELVAEHLAATPPAGWGEHEPALASWNRERLVRLARHRAPRGSLLQFSGPVAAERPFTGGVRVGWDGGHGTERISMVVGCRDEAALPLDALPGLVGALAGEGLLETLHVRRTRGRGDATYAPRWHGLAIPVGMAVGSEGVRRAGAEYALGGPLGGRLLGPEGARAAWYRVPGDAPRHRGAAALTAQMRYLASAPSA